MALDPPLSVFDLKPSDLTRPFWDAARQGRLVVQQCDACAKKFFPPEIACPHCHARAVSWVESSGRGTLYSFTRMERAPAPAFTTPFIFAIVDMDEGWSLFSNLIGLDADDAYIGMALKVDFHAMSDALTIPLFRPA